MKRSLEVVSLLGLTLFFIGAVTGLSGVGQPVGDFLIALGFPVGLEANAGPWLVSGFLLQVLGHIGRLA